MERRAEDIICERVNMYSYEVLKLAGNPMITDREKRIVQLLMTEGIDQIYHF